MLGALDDRRVETSRLRSLALRALQGCLGLVLCLIMATEGHAHTLGESYLYLQIYGDSVSGRFEIALSDLTPALGLSGTDLEITADTFEEKVAFLQAYYLEHVTLAVEQGPVSIDFTEHRI